MAPRALGHVGRTAAFVGHVGRDLGLDLHDLLHALVDHLTARALGDYRAALQHRHALTVEHLAGQLDYFANPTAGISMNFPAAGSLCSLIQSAATSNSFAE